MNECYDCGFWDFDYEQCTCPDWDFIYTCPKSVLVKKYANKIKNEEDKEDNEH